MEPADDSPGLDADADGGGAGRPSAAPGAVDGLGSGARQRALSGSSAGCSQAPAWAYHPAMTSGKRGGPGALILMTVVAIPLALLFETVLRALILPDEFELLRTFLEPYLTPVAWGLVVVCLLAAGLGIIAQSALSVRRLRSLPDDAPAAVRSAALVGVFLLTSGVPQIPALASSFCFMFGASFLPVGIGAGVAGIGVLVQGFRVHKLAEAR